MVGWLAEKNHATVIHAIKVMKDMLEIKDSMTLTSLEAWERVFNMEFGSEGGLKHAFEMQLDKLVIECGLEHSIVERMLTNRAEDIRKLQQIDVSL